MNKKVTLSLLSATVFASMAASAFAAPTQGVYMGGSVDKFYKLDDLFNLSAAAKKQFVVDLNAANPDLDFKNLVFVDFDGKGAKFSEILAAGTLPKAKRDLTKADFEGSYVTVNLDGSNGASYDPRNDAVDVPTGDLKVESVSAINATQVLVKFGVAVDENDAVTKSYYSVGGKNPQAVEVVDSKTVKLTFASAAEVELTNGAVVIEPVKTADDEFKSTARYAGLLSFEDTVNPTVSTVVSTSKTNVADTVTVTFSEPIKSLGAVKIDGVVKSADNFKAGDSTAKFIGLSLDASQSHTIQFVGLTDQGDNVEANLTKSFNVTTDAVAPTAQLSAQGDSTIIVTFDKKMDVNSVKAALADTAKVVKGETLADVGYYSADVVPNSDDKQFFIKVKDQLFTDATTRTLTVVLPGTMKDSLGNTVAATTKQVTLTKDTVAPTLDSLSFKRDNDKNVTAIVLNVSEGLPATKITPSDSNLTIVDENGVLVKTTAFLGGLKEFTPAAGAKQLVFDAKTKGKLSGKYTFTFANGFVADNSQAANKSASKSFTLDFGAADSSNEFEIADTTEGKGKAIDASTTPNVIVVNFGTTVKGGSVTGSATDVNNYTLNGSALPAGTTITLDADKKVATITLPAESIAKTDTAAVFTISNVLNTANAKIKYTTTTVPVKDNVVPVLNSAVLSSDNTITFGFSETLKTDPAKGDVVVTVNGKTLNVADLAPVKGSGLNAGKYVLDLSSLVIYDSTSKNTVIDMDADTKESTGDIVITTGSDTHADFSFISSTLITDIKFGTQASALTAADAESNKAKSDVTIDVK
ncbi:hypothetical protein M655_002850 [Brevibacillus sp. NSP2.1]|uniref:hypothetical protein n=1 Tax=Brevibacillus sp. NSP2.1 TaxID=3003229 RepID=UPI00047DE188|nr:hypothetical protein [Brevibacillus sp. NSP2.1]QHZ54684.1 hypothetical protein M655_002850 [Brevibacillus sp. NSP2.1]